MSILLWNPQSLKTLYAIFQLTTNRLSINFHFVPLPCSSPDGAARLRAEILGVIALRPFFAPDSVGFEGSFRQVYEDEIADLRQSAQIALSVRTAQVEKEKQLKAFNLEDGKRSESIACCPTQGNSGRDFSSRSIPCRIGEKRSRFKDDYAEKPKMFERLQTQGDDASRELWEECATCLRTEN